MHKEIINKIKPEIDKVKSFLEQELLKFRTSRASPSMVEDVEVVCFGSRFPLKQLASISCPKPNQIVIQPWDKSYLEPIEKAISQAGLNLSPIVDNEIIRLTLPSLTQEYRENLLRLISEKAEEAKKTIRHWRQLGWDEIQQKSKEGKIREDDKFRGKDELQKMVDESNEKIEELLARKKKEIGG